MLNRVVILLFLLILILPGLFLLGNFSVDYSGFEKRKLTSWSSLHQKGWKSKDLIEGYSDFIDDRIGFRTEAIKFYNTFCYLFSMSSTSIMKFGKQGWLYNDNELNFEQYKGNKIYQNGRVNVLCKHIKMCQQQIEQQYGATFIYFTAPDKHLIYPEYLPTYMECFENQYKNMDIVNSGLENWKIKHIDIISKLQSQAKNDLLYQKASAHWNHLGAYMGYRQVIESMDDSISMYVYNQDDFKSMFVKQDYHYSMNGYIEALQFEKEDVFLNDNIKDISILNAMDEWELITAIELESNRLKELLTLKIQTENTTGPTLIFVRDSFGSQMLPFLAHSFSEIILVHHLFGQWDQTILDQMDIDYVFYEVAQRNLGEFKKN